MIFVDSNLWLYIYFSELLTRMTKRGVMMIAPERVLRCDEKRL